MESEVAVHNTGSLMLDIDVIGTDKMNQHITGSSSDGSKLNFTGDSLFSAADLSGHVVTASADGAHVLLANGASESVLDPICVAPTVSGHFVADAATLRSLIATGAVQLTDAAGLPIDISGDTTQVFSLLGQPSTSAEIEQPTARQELGKPIETYGDEITDMLSITAVPQITLPPLPTSVPAGTPAWAARLRDFEKIGDYYRGWVENDIELDLLLTYHKQQTHSTWGTRQSPCPAKNTTRLMWKSQYCPFDGIPFLNAGSRAIVMECQFGPRRKGTISKKDLGPLNENFKKTCTARIYVKKVKKFVEYGIELTNDKKHMKAEMDRAFEILKKKEYRAFYQERYYVQLPTIKAHENHMVSESAEVQSTKLSNLMALSSIPVIRDETTQSRLHPLVQNKIRSLVATGETRLYAIRKQLRKYVEKDLFEQADNVPDRHNLTYFPTVNDLQNHIHQAVADINNGSLICTDDSLDFVENSQCRSPAHAETVTVTLYNDQSEGEGHMVSKVETHLSDGTTRVSDTLSPETARLLAKLHPNMFPLNDLLQKVQLIEGQQTSVRLEVPSSSAESQLLAAEAENNDRLNASCSHDRLTISSHEIDLDTTSQTETIDLAAAAELVSMPTEIDKIHTKEDIINVDQSSATRLIASSSDQTGYALVQTETGALLLAKGTPYGGYHVLGQAGATISGGLSQAGSTMYGGVLGNETDQSQVGANGDSQQQHGMLQFCGSLAAGDSSSVMGSANMFSNIKSEVGSGDHQML